MDIDKLKAQLISLLTLFQDGSPEAASAFLQGWPDEESFVADLTTHLAGDGDNEICQHIVAFDDHAARFIELCAPLNRRLIVSKTHWQSMIGTLHSTLQARLLEGPPPGISGSHIAYSLTREHTSCKQTHASHVYLRIF